MGLPAIPRGHRLRGAEKEAFAQAAAAAYVGKKASIRAIAAESGRSFNAIHRALTQQHVALRPRGGPHRHPQKKGTGTS
ncbi:hypothetical protein ADK38_19150 [Streptomyces varsoviensis]|uniref:Helix-turn-helix domain-containing protein n=1 Tax=Streptomyces varsoviensis TaxID=67373 RepID=A0ABR5J513_9ACTN|nr:hypothetical protein ADK38_19150 [Streptomyces varsoviensis]